MEFDFDFLPLFIVLILAWLCPVITSRIKFVKIPSVIIEITAGIIIGPYVLDILPDADYMHFLSLSGFIFLMFLSGLEIDVHRIISSLPRRKLTIPRYLSNPLLVGITIFVATLLLAIGGAYLLSNFVPIQHIWYFSLIISTSSVGVILPVLKERGEIQQHFGQMLVLAAAVADILSILLFTFTTSYIRNGLQYEVFLILSLFALFFITFQIGKRIMNTKLMQKIQYQLAHAASQIKVRGTVVLILLFIILSQWIDAEVILGAFLAGILMSYFSQKDRSTLMMKLEGMGYGFFIPVFFIMVGAGIDFSVFQNTTNLWLFIAVLFVLLYAIKILPSMIWARLFGWNRALSGGILLASRLSLIIAASQVGLDLGVITPAMNTSFIMLAVVTCVASPVIYNQMNRSKGVVDDKTIIVGGGGPGVLLARNLKMHAKQSIIVDLDYDKIIDFQQKGLEAFHGNGADPETYQQLNLKEEDHVVILTNTDKKNYQIAKIVRQELQHQNVISYTIKKANLPAFHNLGVEYLDGAQIIATAIENLIFRPTTYHTLFESFEDFRAETISLKNNKLANEMVKDIPFHQQGFLMLIKRNGELIIPHGNDQLQYDDEVVVFGNDNALEDFKRKFAGNASRENL